MNKRQAVLATALLLTLAATAYVWYHDLPDHRDASPVLAVDHHVASSHALVLQASPDLTRLSNGRKLSEVAKDIFAMKKVPEPEKKTPEIRAPAPSPPQPILLPPQEPPPPSAPPLPFRYLGKLGEDGQYVVFLSTQNKSYAARVGDTIAATYHIDEIKPPMMTVTYLPMKLKQAMPIGEAN